MNNSQQYLNDFPIPLHAISHAFQNYKYHPEWTPEQFAENLTSWAIEEQFVTSQQRETLQQAIIRECSDLS